MEATTFKSTARSAAVALSNTNEFFAKSNAHHAGHQTIDLPSAQRDEDVYDNMHTDIYSDLDHPTSEVPSHLTMEEIDFITGRDNMEVSFSEAITTTSDSASWSSEARSSSQARDLSRMLSVLTVVEDSPIEPRLQVYLLDTVVRRS